MDGPLFDASLAAARMARARASGGDFFLHRRAFDDILDRLALHGRHFRRALLYGHCEPNWPALLRARGVGEVDWVEPGRSTPLPDSPDLCITIGALDTAEALPALLTTFRHLLASNALLIGACSGGDTLPVLRGAMRAADEASGRAAASPHVHPRLAPSSIASLIAEAGFERTVVDVDRVKVRYASLDDLVRDLRRMAATNRLSQRSREPILRNGRSAAQNFFSVAADGSKTLETFDILHFSGWSPA